MAEIEPVGRITNHTGMSSNGDARMHNRRGAVEDRCGRGTAQASTAVVDVSPSGHPFTTSP
jgi:hypothetical protein